MHHILQARTRWVWSFMEDVPGFTHRQPVAREYSSLPWVAPISAEEWELVMCTMTLHQIEAAKQDHRLIVLPSLNSQKPIPQEVSSGLARFGVTGDMTLFAALEHLGDTVDPQFYPEH